MSLRYKDRVVIVTGGAAGIGAATAQLFVENGSKVIIADVQTDQGEQHATHLTSSGPGEAIFVRCDVSKEDEVKNLIEHTVGKYKRIDCVVNNAGIGSDDKIDDLTPENFEAIWGVHVLGTLMVSKHSLPYLRKEQGNIINMSSIMAEVGAGGHDIGYCAAKGAINSLSKSLAISEAKNQVRVNVITPGPVWTSWYKQHEQQFPQTKTKISTWTVLNRCGEAEDIAKTVLYLAADAPFSTGANIHCTGGCELKLAVKAPK